MTELQGVQVPLASIKGRITFKLGGTPDWLAVTRDAVWVSNAKLKAVQRIETATDKVVATMTFRSVPCSGLAVGFGSVWVPLCGSTPSIARIDPATNRVGARLSVGPDDSEGGIAASAEGIWIVTDASGTLVRIDPATNAIAQTIAIASGSSNPIAYDGTIWVTGHDAGIVTAVDASSGKVTASIPVGPQPRFAAAGGGAVWTLNQGDGIVSRIDAKTKRISATIQAGIPGQGGAIWYGGGSVWATTMAEPLPLTRISARSNKVVRQWTGTGGDSVAFGHDSVWLTDFGRGVLWRIPVRALRG